MSKRCEFCKKQHSVASGLLFDLLDGWFSTDIDISGAVEYQGRIICYDCLKNFRRLQHIRELIPYESIKK